MKIAIIHYHLNRGGVTGVLVNHLRAMNQQVPDGTRLSIALLFGGRCQGWPEGLASELDRLDFSLHTVDELDYDDVRPHRTDLGTQLQSTLLQAGYHPHESVLHAHNHALGKNVALPVALSKLACEGYALLLQIHDFAEDSRPDQYRALASALAEDGHSDLPSRLYPQAPQVHYAVLNSRDYTILHQAGVETSHLHLLPNAVAEMKALPAREEARAKLADRFGIAPDHCLVLYPVRGIRRKNIGETLLWSALAERETCFGVTLPPLNPLEQPSYSRWKELAAALDLPVVFDVGGENGLAFAENLAAADAMLTTSVAEGFGLVFLESWLTGKPLVGRDLPEITVDFQTAGIRFTGLGAQLLLPVGWLNQGAFRAEIAGAYQGVLKSYGQPLLAAAALQTHFDRMFRDDLVDFAECGVAVQREIIERVAHDLNSRDRLLQINPWIRRALQMREADLSVIGQNAEVVRTKYSLANCGQRLHQIYQRIDTSDRQDVLRPLPQGNHILASFLGLSRFRPVRVAV